MFNTSKTILIRGAAIALVAVAGYAQIGSAPVQEDAAKFGPAITGYCRAPRTLTMGRPDGFTPNGPENPPPVSPAMQAFINKQKPAGLKGFDDGKTDVWLPGSWQISGCRVCNDDVRLTMNIRRASVSNGSTNDAIYFGSAPFATTDLLANMQNKHPWQISEQNTADNGQLTRTVTFIIARTAINTMILNAPPGPVWLDFLVQDDTEVDSVSMNIVQ